MSTITTRKSSTGNASEFEGQSELSPVQQLCFLSAQQSLINEVNSHDLSDSVYDPYYIESIRGLYDLSSLLYISVTNSDIDTLDIMDFAKAVGSAVDYLKSADPSDMGPCMNYLH